jgi:hypothetical protein
MKHVILGLARVALGLWASSEAGGQWLDAKNGELWLVPEVDGTGAHTYLVPQMETFTYTFNS